MFVEMKWRKFNEILDFVIRKKQEIFFSPMFRRNSVRSRSFFLLYPQRVIATPYLIHLLIWAVLFDVRNHQENETKTNTWEKAPKNAHIQFSFFF